MFPLLLNQATLSSTSARADNRPPSKSRSENLLRDIISLAGEAKNLAKEAVKGADESVYHGPASTQDADETEEEDFM